VSLLLLTLKISPDRTTSSAANIGKFRQSAMNSSPQTLYCMLRYLSWEANRRLMTSAPLFLIQQKTRTTMQNIGFLTFKKREFQHVVPPPVQIFCFIFYERVLCVSLLHGARRENCVTVLKIDNFFPGASPFIFGCVREFFVTVDDVNEPSGERYGFCLSHNYTFILCVIGMT
jgi:hypothetical protein